MKRAVTLTCAALALVVFAGLAVAADKAVKAQMVKGTIKSIDTKTAVLVVAQKVKNETVDRELSIVDGTEIVLMVGKDKKEGLGKIGMDLLVGQEGAQVQVKCDKDVKVLKITVTAKK